MEREQTATSPIYRKIAIDIAKNIASGKYVEGQKLYGRSVLASQYKVSPETIRKAVYILKDIGIVDIEKGRGIEVISLGKAREFIECYAEIETITTISGEIIQWARKQVKETADMVSKLQFVVDTAGRIKNISPLTPFELNITGGAAVIGKTANELQFWHNTGGTIVAIRREDSLIVSPGPYATFQEGDIFYMIGNEQSYLAAKKLLFG